MRGERGQTAAEYLGALLLVGVIVLAVVTSGADATIASETKRIVCSIAGGNCAAAPATPSRASRTAISTARR